MNLKTTFHKIQHSVFRQTTTGYDVYRKVDSDVRDAIEIGVEDIYWKLNDELKNDIRNNRSI